MNKNIKNLRSYFVALFIVGGASTMRAFDNVYWNLIPVAVGVWLIYDANKKLTQIQKKIENLN